MYQVKLQIIRITHIANYLHQAPIEFECFNYQTLIAWPLCLSLLLIFHFYKITQSSYSHFHNNHSTHNNVSPIGSATQNAVHSGNCHGRRKTPPLTPIHGAPSTTPSRFNHKPCLLQARRAPSKRRRCSKRQLPCSPCSRPHLILYPSSFLLSLRPLLHQLNLQRQSPSKIQTLLLLLYKRRRFQSLVRR